MTSSETVVTIAKKISGQTPGCGVCEVTGPKGLRSEIQEFIDTDYYTRGLGLKVYESDNGRGFYTSNYYIGY